MLCCSALRVQVATAWLEKRRRHRRAERLALEAVKRDASPVKAEYPQVKTERELESSLEMDDEYCYPGLDSSVAIDDDTFESGMEELEQEWEFEWEMG